jgi:hypothetical protein
MKPRVVDEMVYRGTEQLTVEFQRKTFAFGMRAYLSDPGHCFNPIPSHKTVFSVNISPILSPMMHNLKAISTLQ